MANPGFDGISKVADCICATTLHELKLSGVEQGFCALFALPCRVRIMRLIDGGEDRRLTQEHCNNRARPLLSVKWRSIDDKIALSIAARTDLRKK